LLQMELAVALRKRWAVHRHLVIVLQQVLIIDVAGRHCCTQQMLRKNYARAESWAIPAMITFTYPIEAVAGSDNPSIGGRPLQIAAKVFKNCWIVRWNRGEVVEVFIDAGSEASCGYVVAKNAAINYLSKKRRLRNKLIEQMRNVLLAFGHESFFVTRTPAEGNDNYFLGPRQSQGANGSKTEQSGARGCSRDGTEKVTAMRADSLCYLTWAAAGPVQEIATRDQNTSDAEIYFYHAGPLCIMPGKPKNEKVHVSAVISGAARAGGI